MFTLDVHNQHFLATNKGIVILSKAEQARNIFRIVWENECYHKKQQKGKTKLHVSHFY